MREVFIVLGQNFLKCGWRGVLVSLALGGCLILPNGRAGPESQLLKYECGWEKEAEIAPFAQLDLVAWPPVNLSGKTI